MVSVTVPLHTDIIKDTFWKENAELLSMGKITQIENSCDLNYFYNKKVNLS